ncbi:MAG: hypothetical protein LBJ02_01495 [Bifidobacteriaceae bacterium]|jgi:hypothetical protein|nr:hypothetical protein [Bifidobacteriaceae bacterium]
MWSKLWLFFSGLTAPVPALLLVLATGAVGAAVLAANGRFRIVMPFPVAREESDAARSRARQSPEG